MSKTNASVFSVNFLYLTIRIDYKNTKNRGLKTSETLLLVHYLFNIFNFTLYNLASEVVQSSRYPQVSNVISFS